eukprot:Platyproteum_vivax@DN6652_c0_g1_i1.p1
MLFFPPPDIMPPQMGNINPYLYQQQWSMLQQQMWEQQQLAHFHQNNPFSWQQPPPAGPGQGASPHSRSLAAHQAQATSSLFQPWNNNLLQQMHPPPAAPNHANNPYLNRGNNFSMSIRSPPTSWLPPDPTSPSPPSLSIPPSYNPLLDNALAASAKPRVKRIKKTGSESLRGLPARGPGSRGGTPKIRGRGRGRGRGGRGSFMGSSTEFLGMSQQTGDMYGEAYASNGCSNSDGGGTYDSKLEPLLKMPEDFNTLEKLDEKSESRTDPDALGSLHRHSNRGRPPLAPAPPARSLKAVPHNVGEDEQQIGDKELAPPESIQRGFLKWDEDLHDWWYWKEPDEYQDDTPDNGSDHIHSDQVDSHSHWLSLRLQYDPHQGVLKAFCKDKEGLPCEEWFTISSVGGL